MSGHLVIMAAGTGGHVMPGLAVASEMRSRGWSVSWMGTPAGMENELVPRHGISVDRLPFAGLRGKGALQAIKGTWQLLRSVSVARGLLRDQRTRAVLGMGGYVCVPGGLAAASCRLPLVLVNADAAPLLSNRALARWARRIAVGFDGSAARIWPQAVVTGNPVRAAIEAIEPPEQRFAGRSGPLKLLVLGGSLGARVLNETVPAALAQLPPDERPLIVHQTGAAHLETTRARYTTLGLTADVVAFIDDMAQQLAVCDGVICRAGAITVSELCAGGVASVLVPLIVGTTAHQVDNAQWMAEQHAALHLPQAELTPARLVQVWRGLSRERLQAMAVQARLLARAHAAARVADEIEKAVQA